MPELNDIVYYAVLILLFTIIASVFSGERINFVIRVCSGLVSALFYRVSVLKLIVVFSVFLEVFQYFFIRFLMSREVRRPYSR